MHYRQNQILDLINQEKFVSVNDLSQSIGVSEVTIRKDLKTLDEEGLIVRTHGGASALPEGVQPFLSRQGIKLDEKHMLAARAVDFINDEDSVLIDAGTTSLRVAELLKDKKITVVTNSLPVAVELANSKATVNMTGGILFPENMCLVGPEAEAYIGRIKVNKLILGASGVLLDAGPMTSSSLEAIVKKKMIEAARMVILVMDYSKLSEVGLSVFADFTKIDILITSTRASVESVQHIESHGVKVIRVAMPTLEEE